MQETPVLIPGSGSSPGEGIGYPLQYSWASLVVQTVKNLPAMQETQVRSLDWEDPLEKEMVTHSSSLAWEIPWTEEPGGLQSMGSQRVGHDLATDTFFSHCILSGILSWKDNGSEFPQVPCFCRVPQALRCCFFTLTICRGHGRSKSMFRAHLRRM